jgi:hypothetical protein
MKIPCAQWEGITDGTPTLSCAKLLVNSLNKEAPTYLDEFLVPEALSIQLEAIRDEHPAVMDKETRARLLDTFSADMVAARPALLKCAREHSDVYYWAHPPGGDKEIDAADRALAESVLAPPPDADAEPPAPANETGAAAALRHKIAASSSVMAGVERVPMNSVWVDPIPDVSPFPPRL